LRYYYTTRHYYTASYYYTHKLLPHNYQINSRSFVIHLMLLLHLRSTV